MNNVLQKIAPVVSATVGLLSFDVHLLEIL